MATETETETETCWKRMVRITVVSNRNMNIHYFLIKDRIKAVDVTINYCPTRDIVGDNLTRPLRGHLFRKFRSVIMNVSEDTPDSKCLMITTEVKHPVPIHISVLDHM